MKNIFENLYIFSKLTLTLVLFGCLIGLLYILYINYQNQNNLSIKEANIEKEIQININKNSNLIEGISKEIKTTQLALSNIEKNIKSINDNQNKDEISKLDASIKILNENFKKLSSEIDNVKTKKSQTTKVNSSETITSGISDILDMILLKYENNISVENEIKFLENKIDVENYSALEKISILEQNKYKGHLYLQSVFDQETSIYLKKIINKNPDSLFSKIVLPYLKISPTSENSVTDDLILKVKDIKKNIENRNIDKAYNSLKNIKDHEIIFELSTFEMKKFLDFKSEIVKLKK